MLFSYHKKDLSPCTDIFVAAFNAPPLDYPFVTVEKARRYLRDITGTPGFAGFVYRVENTLAAFCFGSTDDYFYDPQYVIKEFAVHPCRQGKGIGTAFLSAIENHLTDNGIKGLSLQTSRTIPAYHFYKKNGFSVSEETVTFMKSLC
jgi:aminoglycoside 6'-N-acetyltransferase I